MYALSKRMGHIGTSINGNREMHGDEPVPTMSIPFSVLVTVAEAAKITGDSHLAERWFDTHDGKLAERALKDFQPYKLRGKFEGSAATMWVGVNSVEIKFSAARFATLSFDPQTGKLSPGAPPGRSLPDPTRPPNFESGGGGLFSTLDDYARFAQMLVNKGALDGVRILAPATVELMGTNVVPPAVLKDPAQQFYKIFNENIGFGIDFQIVMRPREAGKLEGAGTMSWEGAAGTWFWVDPTNDVIFVGMIQNFLRAGGAGFDPITRPLVYQALVDPKK